jgi:hypothetical protein
LNVCSPGTGSPISARKRVSAFVLGHALYMKAIHGGKAKNDKIDSKKIAVLLTDIPHPNPSFSHELSSSVRER